MRARRFRPWRLVWLAGLLAGAGWYALSPFLAAWLVVADPIQKADAIVVLGGSFERTLHAYELYRDGYAPRLLVSGQQIYQFELDGRPFTEARFSKIILRGLGVPDRAVTLLGRAVNTYEEARATAAYSRRQGWRRLILVSSPYHMRRARRTFRKQLSGSGIRLIAQPARQSWFRPQRSFQPRWVKAIAHEYLGLVQYWWLDRL